MKKEKVLFKSNINHLKKVLNALALSQTMQNNQIILCEENQKFLLNATVKINAAICDLSNIKRMH